VSTFQNNIEEDRTLTTDEFVRQRPPWAVSMNHVAARAGVSLGMVSNVLNRPDLVSEARRVRVERAVVNLGFVRNESARQHQHVSFRPDLIVRAPTAGNATF